MTLEDSKGRPVRVFDYKDGTVAIDDGRKEVTTAGTAEPLVDESTPARIVVITAETDNTGVIVVGGENVIAALATRRGTPLMSGESIPLEVADLADIYIDATVSGDGVTYISEL